MDVDILLEEAYRYSADFRFKPGIFIRETNILTASKLVDLVNRPNHHLSMCVALTVTI